MKKSIEAIVRETLAEMDLADRVARALARMPRASVIAIGKAAETMMAGAHRTTQIEEALVVGPHDAGHPIPDARSVRAGEACLALAASADHPLVVLVSGGASALVCAPAKGVSLAEKKAVTRTMIRSGASIQELNVVRKHLSRIKGGGLARAAKHRRVLTLVASDVIGGHASDIGSGPTAVDPSTRAEARALLKRYAPRFSRLPLAETKGGGRARILASPEELARLVAKKLSARLLRPSQASVESLAAEYVALAARLPENGAIVRAAEPSLVVRGRGAGGRSTHLATLVARGLPRGTRFLALATDGVDGSSCTGGAFIHGGFASSEEIDGALAGYDTGSLVRHAGVALPHGPSGHNLADLHILIRGRP